MSRSKAILFLAKILQLTGSPTGLIKFKLILLPRKEILLPTEVTQSFNLGL